MSTNDTPAGTSTSRKRDDLVFGATWNRLANPAGGRNWTISAPLWTGSSGGGTPGLALGLVGSIAYLWFLRADFHEGYRWSKDALAVDDAPGRGGFAALPPPTRPSSGPRHRPGRGSRCLSSALTDLRQARSPDLGGALLVISEVLARLGDFEASQEVLAEAFPLIVEKGTHGMSPPTTCSPPGTWRPRAERRGRGATRARVDQLRACGDHWMILYGLGMLAGIEESHGDFAAAAALRGAHRGVPVGRNGPLRVDVADPTGHATGPAG